ncbi:hypothetical protein VB713_04130 [Anabaena cylindrica UHCC 0172]|uniref:hypothetical protein n=1 Tax=Anabaena cylindrica TaxID=1165 RepID=UPI002B2007C6|nr:hypothetical protein [Anabaena cylindrica]MEA5550176.1 hypothetical protein [Anabaena cylindrica UHCC 0172]
MNNIQYDKVKERLLLAKRIFEQSEQLRGRDLLTYTEKGWTHPYIQHEALVNYLLLTCFDILGQPHEWKDFNSWLTSKKTKSEREEAMNLILDCDTNIEATQKIYTFYQNKYGVKQSFYRFIDEILDNKERDRLLSSVQIEKRDENSSSVIIDDPAKKKLFLYNSRNIFTHQAELTGNAGGGILPKMIFIRNGKLLSYFECVRKQNSYFYSIKRWPFELFEIISNAIGETINIYDFDAACKIYIQFDECNKVCIIDDKLAVLKDINGLINYARHFLDLQ